MRGNAATGLWLSRVLDSELISSRRPALTLLPPRSSSLRALSLAANVAKVSAVTTSPAPSSTAVIVRPAEVSDLPRLADLFDAYRQFYGQPSRRPRAEAFLRERLERGDSKLFVAVHEGRIEGFTQLYPSFSSLSMGPIWVFNDIFVAPDARGGGIGSALLERAHRLAEETGAAHMTLATARDNRSAIELYQRAGWQADDAFLHMYLPVKDRVAMSE